MSTEGLGVPVTTFHSKPRSRRRRRFLLISAIGIVLILVVAVFGGSWYFSDQLLDVTHGPTAYDVSVLSRTSRTVTLSAKSGIADSGRFGLEWKGGRAIVGPVSRTTGNGVTRALLSPAPLLQAGAKVRYNVFVYDSPAEVGVKHRSLTYPDTLGSMPAWLIPGSSSTWVIAVHGLGSMRAEAIREMRPLHRLGLAILDIDYRNDSGAPAGSDHLYHLGATEWLDLQAAAAYALHHGARHLILYGYSMGGNIVENFMEHSLLARQVRAVILDAPALDWYQILELASKQRDLPGVFAAFVERVVAWRLGLFSLDPVDLNLAHFAVFPPTLLFQGTADDLVPPASTLEFATKHRPFVTYVLVPGAGHVQSWNVEPAAYDRTLTQFLRRHLACSNHGRRRVCV